MKNLVQIINGCAAAETIEECARVPQMLGATVVVVHGLWPKYDYPNSDPNFAEMAARRKPTDHIDNVVEIVRKNNWHFIQMEEFAYNGRQYNLALKYLREKEIPFDHVWFVDADECIDPYNVPTLLSEIEALKGMNIDSIRFRVRAEIVPGWRMFGYDILQGNYGIVWGAGLLAEREEYFDGNFKFRTPVSFGASSVPLLHLHHFRKNASNRIINGFWHGGGAVIDLATAQPVYASPYIDHIKQRYPEFHVDREGPDSYIGASIFEGETK